MDRSRTIWLLVLLLGLTMGKSGFADEKASEKKAPPTLAGFGMVQIEHSCTRSYMSCTKLCSRTGGANCELECLSDCNVCSLDFGEEALDVCRH